MANPFKGEVPLTVGADTYTLSFSANALCELEDALDKPLDEIIEMLRNAATVRLSTMRVMFWQALRDHHPDMTLEDTKAILRQVSPKDMGGLIGRAFSLAMPEDKADENPKKPADPPSGIGPA